MSEALPYQHLYEVLLRFDGPATLRGAHVQYIEGYALDGEAISAKLGDALPLSLANKTDATTLKGALGAANLALLTAKEAAEADAAAARAEFKAKDDNTQDLLATIEGLRADLAAAAKSETGKLLGEIAAKDANIQALMAQLADAQAK